jgi:hypothetical protein
VQARRARLRWGYGAALSFPPVSMKLKTTERVSVAGRVPLRGARSLLAPYEADFSALWVWLETVGDQADGDEVIQCFVDALAH